MTVVSTREFNTNQKKYFDIALNDQLYIKRGSNMFVVTKANEEKKVYKEPDDDLRRAITMNEFKVRVIEDLREIFNKGKR